jgi:hypothetical protein
MSQPLELDAVTALRQAAARWPRQTLNTQGAQSFLKSLADELEHQQQEQPATGHTFARADLGSVVTVAGQEFDGRTWSPTGSYTGKLLRVHHHENGTEILLDRPNGRGYAETSVHLTDSEPQQ